ncbi:MAG: HAD family hydrolase [Planctomycetota bacterium]
MANTIEGFDIFDTVLTRSVSPPSAVFWTLGQWLRDERGLTISPAYFAEQREEAERRSAAHRGHANSIHDIYRELTDTLMFDPGDAPELIRKELELEKQATFVIEPVAELIRDCRAAGKKIMFISDMYYPEGLMRELLEHHSVIEPEDKLYVSCDHGFNKSSGQLFTHVMKAEGFKASDIAFHGNNEWADVRGAQKRGIHSTHRPLANPNRYEAILEDARQETDGLSMAFAGASRAARLAVDAKNEHEAVIRDVAAGVAGPMLVSYVYWILRRSENMGLKRLYFLSRDGQVLFDIAKKLVEKWDLEIDCRYIYASRQAWGRAFLDESVRAWVWGDVVEGTSLRDILTRLSVRAEDVIGDLDKLGYGADRLDDGLDRADVYNLRDYFASEEFAKTTFYSRQRHRDMLRDYLDGVGMLEDVPKAIVDIGWTGTLHESLSILLDDLGAPPVHAFLFGLNLNDTTWKGYRHGFFYDTTRELGLLNPLERKNLFVMSEVFCAADHGTVSGFKRHDDDSVTALLAEGWEGRVIDWGLPIFRKTLDALVDALPVSDFRAPLVVSMRYPLNRIIRAFWTDPTEREAAVWGSFPWDAGQGDEDKVNQLVRPYYGPKDFIRRTVFRKRPPYKNNIYWVEGSLAVSPGYFRAAVRQTNRLLDRLWPLVVKAKKIKKKLRP